MANQAIALQARAPQNDFMGRAIQQNAQMMNMMSQRRASQRQAAQAEQEMELARVEEARRAELHGPAMDKARSEATAAGIKTALDFSNFVYTGLSNAADPAQAMQIAQRIGQQPQFQEELFQGALVDAMATMPQDPAQFEVWKEETLAKTLEGAKRLERDLIQQNLGTFTRIVSAPKYGRGSATVLEGSEAPVTMKPTVVNVEGIGPIIVDPNTGQGFPAAAGPTGGYRPPQGAPAGGPAPRAPAGGGDTFSRMINVESRGQQFDRSGRPLTSRAGAIGIAQVMPGTAPEAARLAGLPFDENRYRNDPEYNFALGKAYYEKQLADFGDERLAAAAYNAGPGAVRRALQKGGRDGWVSHVPRETQKYLQDVFGGAPAGRGSAGGAEEPPRTVAQAASAAEKQRRAKTFQELTGVDLATQVDTDTDRVSQLIKGSTSGVVEAVGAELVGALPESVGGGATSGMKNIGQLETIATTLTLAFAPDGRLSTGVSNEDRRVIERQLGRIQDPMVPSGKRLAAWREVKRIMARTIGLTGTPSGRGGGASIPTLTPEQVRANPKIKRWRTTDGRIMSRP